MRSPALWTEVERQAFRSAVLTFFEEVKRPLPWRTDRDPYRVLVSEFMLQQTRVDTVVPYFERWMAHFPDARTLAAADRDEVLHLWQGLGYYSRARNLHDAVRAVVANHGGAFPSDPEELRTLPGVGPYTAGAVASIAFGAVVPAVDGNVRRVMARLADDPSPSPTRLEGWVGPLVDPERPGDFNQGLMELGALVCTPRAPRCGDCPVRAMCAAREAGTAESRPQPRAHRAVPRFDEGVAVILRAGRALYERRPAKGLLGGMWSFPGATAEAGEAPRAAALRKAAELGVGGDRVISVREHPSLDHAFSHRRVRYHPFEIRIAELPAPSSWSEEVEGYRWIAPGEALLELPLPTAQRRITEALEGEWGRSKGAATGLSVASNAGGWDDSAGK